MLTQFLEHVRTISGVLACYNSPTPLILAQPPSRCLHTSGDRNCSAWWQVHAVQGGQVVHAHLISVATCGFAVLRIVLCARLRGGSHPMNRASATSCESGSPRNVAMGGGSGSAGMHACEALRQKQASQYQWMKEWPQAQGPCDHSKTTSSTAHSSLATER